MSGQSSKLSGEVTADFSRLLHGKKRKEGGERKDVPLFYQGPDTMRLFFYPITWKLDPRTLLCHETNRQGNAGRLSFVKSCARCIFV